LIILLNGKNDWRSCSREAVLPSPLDGGIGRDPSRSSARAAGATGCPLPGNDIR